MFVAHLVVVSVQSSLVFLVLTLRVQTLKHLLEEVLLYSVDFLHLRFVVLAVNEVR